MDAKDVILQKIKVEDMPPPLPVVKDGTVLVHMKGSSGSWTTPSGAKFTKRSPYQVVPEDEANVLLDKDRFEEANEEDVHEFFGV